MGPGNFLSERKGHSCDPQQRAIGSSTAMLPRAQSSSSLLLRSRRRQRTAPASAPPRSAPPASSARTTRTARSRRDSLGILPAPARERTETNQHRVSCSMVDNMDVKVSAERLASPRSQRSGRSTDDVPLAQHEIGRVLCVCVQTCQTDDRSHASHHVFKRLCLR